MENKIIMNFPSKPSLYLNNKTIITHIIKKAIIFLKFVNFIFANLFFRFLLDSWLLFCYNVFMFRNEMIKSKNYVSAKGVMR